MNSYVFRIERPFYKWRVRPFPGESAFSYFHRLVRDQEDCLPGSYASALGLPTSKIGANEVLEALLKLPITVEQKASLAKWTPLPVGGQFTLNDTPLHNRIIPMCRQRYCPECIAEAPFHRVWWDIEGFETCPFHGLMLRRWATKKYPVTWPPFYGKEVKRPDYEQSELDHDTESFEAYLLRRIGFLKQEGCQSPLLDVSSLDDVIWYSGTLGRFLRNSRSRRRPRAEPQDYQAGFDALRRDREALVEAITEWLTANNSSEELQKGASFALGWSHTFAQSKIGGKIGKEGVDLKSTLAREIILSQTLACAKVGSVGAARLGRADIAFWPIALTHAARKLDVSVKALWRIVKSLGISIEISISQNMVNEAQFKAMSDFVGKTVDARETLRRLGCTQTQLERLVSRGYVRRINFSSKKASRYSAEELAEILRRIDALPDCQGREITIAEAARRRRTSEAVIMIAFIKGDYPAFKASKGAGFQSLRISDNIPIRLRNRGGKPQSIGRKDASETGMLRAEFRVMTGFTTESVSALLKHKHLHLLVDDRVEPRLDRERAMTFHAQYMNPAPYMKCHPRVLRKELTRLGVPFHFSNICSKLIVEREVFEAATGIVTIPRGARVIHLWESLRSAFKLHAPSFSIPKTLAASRMGVWTTAIKAYFVLHVDECSFRFEKKLDPKHFRREYAVYAADPAAFRAALSGFEWRDEGDVAEFTASTPEEIERAAVALGRMCDLLRVKQPAIQRKKKD